MAVKRALIDLTPLRSSPAFRRLWAGRALSGLGGQMTIVAVMFQVWKLTGSTVWTGAAGLAQALPIVAFGMFAGSIVDRSDRRRLYLITTTGQAACSALLAVQGFTGHLPAIGVLTLVGAQSCFVAGGGPAARTFVRRLLPEEQVAAGLTLNMAGFQAALLAGPALAGLVLGWLGVGGCYLIDAITFGAAIYGALGLPPMPPPGEPARRVVRDVLAGIDFLVRDRAVRGALITDLAATVLSFPVSLFPLINTERFGGDPRTLGLFLTAIAVGGALASLFSGLFTRLPGLGLVMLAAAAAWGIALVLFALAPNPWLGLAFLVVAGAADAVSVVSRSTVVQLRTPGAMLGRVSSAEQIVGQAGPDLGNLRAGLVAAATSGTASLVSGGLLCLAAVGIVAAITPELRRRPAPAGAGRDREGDMTDPAAAA